jgi:hypothetical protein
MIIIVIIIIIPFVPATVICFCFLPSTMGHSSCATHHRPSTSDIVIGYWSPLSSAIRHSPFAIRHLPSPFAIHYQPSSVIIIGSLPSSPYHCHRRCRRMRHHDVLNSAIRTAVHMLTLHPVALEASLALF